MRRLTLLLAWLILSAAVFGQSKATSQEALSPELHALYVDLHQTPELSLHEEKTAAKMAGRLRKLGFEVTTGVGGTGVVGVLRNGPGPTVMLRTELDALPVEEKTGLPYASRARTKNDDGLDVPVMHACGHDVHMTCWVGTAEAMAASKAGWHGTLILIAQPAEERAMGAKAMLAAGLFTKFPKPDFAIALHDIPTLPSGTVGFSSGPALSGSDSKVARITISFFASARRRIASTTSQKSFITGEWHQTQRQPRSTLSHTRTRPPRGL